MLTDVYFSYFRKDQTPGRNVVKAISWRLIGTLDTVLLVYLITGSWAISIRVGALELLIKTAFFFLYAGRSGRPPAHQLETGKKEQHTDHLFRQYYAITKEAREQLNKHPAFTIWLTGLSGSGKSTLASELDRWLHRQGIHSYIIDGDNTRLGINKDLDFSREGRQENIRRVAEMCRLFNEAGIVVISSFISPFEKDRQDAAAIIGKENFTEVFIDASLETCAARDKKGLYQLAREGKIKDFTGIGSPYEAPAQPDLHIQTDHASIEESINTIIQWIQKNKLATYYAPTTGTKTSLFQ
jgi:adenylylsulfate kinase